ncbi:HEAT repeat domain-containing protein [Cellulomonas citrea]|uniref:HEAT repeat domain-containing protein n=1 Tax=Cellulomonas citrea TaxID=1909423 RepID=UPI0019159D4D|nr:HEAT repeat domain-containing protein [Cellulomonas citrea]
MTTRRTEHAAALRSLPDAELRAYLTAHSGLPGPRANLELMAAAADVLTPALALTLADDEDEYLRCCGVVTLGRLVLEHPDDPALVDLLTARAADPSWRVREAAAMAGQRIGDGDPDRLVALVRAWTDDRDPLVVRAGIAAICEPRLLREGAMAAAALAACSQATEHLRQVPSAHRRDADVRVLRQGLAYCWSVAVAADPVTGLPVFEALSRGPAGSGVAQDGDIAWVVAQNLRKKRLARLLDAPSS